MGRNRNASSHKTLLANAIATFPPVNTSTYKVVLNRPPEEGPRRHASPPGFLGKLFGFFNPFVWSTAYLFAAFFTLTITGLTNLGIRIEARQIHSPLIGISKISSEIGWGLFLCASFTLFAFHFLLNYRRHGRGGIIKAYWYASWAFSLSFFFLPWVHLPLSAHKANQINQYCFVSKRPEKCEKTLKSVYKGQRQKEVARHFPEMKRLWVDRQLKRFEPAPVLLLPKEEFTRVIKPNRSAPRTLDGMARYSSAAPNQYRVPSRRLAYQH